MDYTFFNARIMPGGRNYAPTELLILTLSLNFNTSDRYDPLLYRSYTRRPKLCFNIKFNFYRRIFDFMLTKSFYRPPLSQNYVPTSKLYLDAATLIRRRLQLPLPLIFKFKYSNQTSTRPKLSSEADPLHQRQNFDPPSNPTWPRKFRKFNIFDHAHKRVFSRLFCPNHAQRPKPCVKFQFRCGLQFSSSSTELSFKLFDHDLRDLELTREAETMLQRGIQPGSAISGTSNTSLSSDPHRIHPRAQN
ncbi:hypothetical protein B0H16DRAFT_1683323 [Mycena metata]|uniref:Uncharacterized protein n=1 Tax=Mycena metata TaxID=1033252 RepID=A0AAD7K643_9AGAR|nr:hypothetical protein B0H16DRAFT_1683323 [Mycena metata]